MQILILNTDDFIFTVECANLETSFAKAKRKQANLDSDTAYKWNIPTGSIEVYNPENSGVKAVAKGAQSNPVFFENKDYVFDVFFKCEIEKPNVFSKSKEITKKFYYRKERKVIAGTINFGNDIGKSDFIVDYFKDEELKQFEFQFEVFPTKLDFKKDYNRILRDIESEYPFLVLDYLKKTYTSFKTGSKDKSDLIWWQIFGGLFEEFIKASEFILNKPSASLIDETRFVRADKLKKINIGIEQELARYKYMPDKLYRIEEKILAIDTVENRFFKHAIITITTKFERIKKYIEKKYGDKLSDSFQVTLDEIEKKLKSFKYAQFFKAIGQFKGLRQESLVLQKATGYTTIYKDWIMLNRGIDFLEGVQKLELKNIADLYQIWCFLEMKNLLKSILGRDPDKIKLAKIQVDDFVFKVQTGVKSQVTFLSNDNEKIDLYHDFQYSNRKNDLNRSYTVKQRPDIVLKISKSDLRDNFYFTYLYDAKYRLQSDDDESKADVPPEDAINQMHRYRDAIYFKSPAKERPEKEVIGGYILFPGNGSVDSIRESDFYKSIKDVNIGAFPLKPNDSENKMVLKDHLKTILKFDSENILHEIAPLKDFEYEPFNPDVLIGIVQEGAQQEYFTSELEPIYHTRLKPRKIDVKNLRYFAAYFEKNGIKYYYEIEKVHKIPRSSIFPEDHILHRQNTNDEYWTFELKNRKELADFYKIDDGRILVIRYSKLSYIRNPQNDKIRTTKF